MFISLKALVFRTRRYESEESLSVDGLMGFESYYRTISEIFNFLKEYKLLVSLNPVCSLLCWLCGCFSEALLQT